MLKRKYLYLICGLTFLSFSLGIIYNTSINFKETSDYRRYEKRLNSTTFTDIPLSFIIMKISINIFGNRGLYYVSIIFSSTLLIFLMIKLWIDKKYRYFCLFPILFIGNFTMRSTLRIGLIRSLMGFSILMIGSLYDSKKLNSYIILLLTSLIYYPSTVYYIIYKTIKRENIKQIYLIASFITIISLILSLNNPYWYKNLLSTLEIITPFNLTHIRYHYDAIFSFPNFKQWLNYIILTIPIIIIGFLDYHQTKNKESLSWSILYCLIFIPFRGSWLTQRLILISWVPFYMIIYHSKEELNNLLLIAYLSVYFIHNLKLDYILLFEQLIKNVRG